MGTPRAADEPLYDFCVAAPREQEPTEGVIYVNWARTMASPFDLILDLGFRTDEGPPSSFPVRAVMTWEQARDLLDLLRHEVEHFEQEVGSIRDFGGEIVDARHVEDS